MDVHDLLPVNNTEVQQQLKPPSPPVEAITACLCLSLSTGGLVIRNYKTVPLMVISLSMSSLAATFAINLAVILKATVTVVAKITAL